MSEFSTASIHPNLKQLSHSSSVLLHKCPRKYEIYKLSPPKEGRDENDEHTLFGHAVGAGVQKYLETGDAQATAFSMYLGWPVPIDADEGESARKTFWHSLYALDKFIGLRQTSLAHYELAHFDSKPATELGFSIDCGDGFTYRGKLDALLLDRRRNELCVLENKTTKYGTVHEATFKHSGQSLGYSLVVDAIATLLGINVGSAYKVIYLVYKTRNYEWERFDFSKSYTHRANWIRQLLLDKIEVIQRSEEEYFPMHGENCMDFFRPCPYYGMCESSNRGLFLTPDRIVTRVDDPNKYPFKFKLEDLIDAQLKRQME